MLLQHCPVEHACTMGGDSAFNRVITSPHICCAVCHIILKRENFSQSLCRLGW